MGKLTLSAVRNAIAIGLGHRLEGTFEDILESLPVDAPTPFLAITDEYAAIPVPGYSEVLTQGRGLGICAVVANQDYAGLKRADEIGAHQIVANTKVKFAMTLEDPTDTWHLFRDLAAEADVLQTEGYRIEEDGKSLSYRDKRSASFTRTSRLHIRDLQEQVMGEFHAFFKGQIVRGSAFYADVPLPSHLQLRINELLVVSKPDERALRMRFGDIKKLTDTLVEALRKGAAPVQSSKTPETASALLQVFNHPGRQGRMEQAICAFMTLRAHTRANVDALRKANHANKNPPSQIVPDPIKNAVPVRSAAATSDVDIPPAAPSWQNILQQSTAWCRTSLGDSLEDDLARGEQLLGTPPVEAARKAASTAKQMATSLAYPDPPAPAKTPEKEDEVMNAVRRLLAGVGESLPPTSGDARTHAAGKTQ